MRLTLRFAFLALIAFASTSKGQEPIPTVKAVGFEAPSVGRTMKYNIGLPAGYDASGDKRYPVLYLLHGFSSNYTAWAKLGAVKAAKGLDLIVVMPDVGNSWYLNYAESDDGQKNAWEEFIVKDLIGHVDATYRTIARREGRAINGLSMGGYGGITVGLRHPDLFCSIGSHSGALGFARTIGERLRSNQPLAKRKNEPSPTPNKDIDIEGFQSQLERTPKGKLFTKPEQADAVDPFKLVLAVPKDKLPHIYVDCGTEDGLIKASREFAKLCMDNTIPFTYAESTGGHSAPYWAREIGTSVAVQYAVIRRNLATIKEDKGTPKPEPKKDFPTEKATP